MARIHGVDESEARGAVVTVDGAGRAANPGRPEEPPP